MFLLLPTGQPTQAIEALLGELRRRTMSCCSRAEPAAGRPSQAPFDLIVLVGSVTAIPRACWSSCGETGRLATVVEHGRSGKVTIVRKINGAIGRVTPFDAQVSRLPGLRTDVAFQF